MAIASVKFEEDFSDEEAYRLSEEFDQGMVVILTQDVEVCDCNLPVGIDLMGVDKNDPRFPKFPAGLNIDKKLKGSIGVITETFGTAFSVHFMKPVEFDLTVMFFEMKLLIEKSTIDALEEEGLSFEKIAEIQMMMD